MRPGCPTVEDSPELSHAAKQSTQKLLLLHQFLELSTSTRAQKQVVTPTALDILAISLPLDMFQSLSFTATKMKLFHTLVNTKTGVCQILRM